MTSTSTQHQRKQPHEVNLMPDPSAPPLVVRWYHAADAPLIDPVSIRQEKAKNTTVTSTSTSTTTTATTTTTTTTGTTQAKTKVSPKSWVPFSGRDSSAIEKAYQDDIKGAKIPVNEDYLFEVDVEKRTIAPIYWEGPIFEIRRATWFIQGDGSKWIPCEENLAEQIEIGYQKRKPYEIVHEHPESNIDNKTNITSSIESTSAHEESKLKTALESQPVEKQWNLLGAYLEQYVVYTGENTAWLLYDTTGSKIAKSIITKLTNAQNLGGTRLLRGYTQVKASESKKSTTATTTTKIKDEQKDQDATKNLSPEEATDREMTQQHTDDYENEKSEGELRQIDHVIFAIHGIGQKLTERFGQTFVHDCNLLRKTMKTCYPLVNETTLSHKANGIQVLPILWRQRITFGMANDEEDREADMGTRGGEDGCPTLDEITLQGIPMYRVLVSDVFLDIPLYMTQKYRDQMTAIITNEINRVYRLFLERNPDFIKNNGKVSILGHSLGSLLAFDILSTQPMTPMEEKFTKSKDRLPLPLGKKTPILDFPVENFFAVGSPLGIILLLRGFKISSRHALTQGGMSEWEQSSASLVDNNQSIPISYYYPAVKNLYNIFHNSDPVAYRLEPLIARHYGAKEKPVPIPYIKGGLKGVLDASFNMGTGLAKSAGAFFDSFKTNWTNSVIMRGFGLNKIEDTHTGTNNDDSGEKVEMGKFTNEKSMGAKKLAMLNPNTGRVDFCLQEGILENAYFSALSVHMNYWQVYIYL
ncbi:DDHD domain-containing protein [Halteromyces radiatus]|uniref:DDHD domain-containing protein n=1 Tax=Halteromyces radiatus TaxID=101107 RepID=UPI00221EDF5B|nr:DDHD domain-containing protein [Halteromyces radiatus]KAI8093670.1 DDHD domain-containing protein [Halteromyces radiatus]